ncbi:MULTISPECIES: autotransporter outer membrane beta-barrel domain-containing protein [unclassified Chelatococcus]|uniref:autotransporter outer membrane beta-barrel domain-containing protein n=1 Tax=unclassified Chelatococcus TaxID=2638111 RepID=UPI001BCBC9EA|nr:MULTISPECIES: autotransporter outer membrane beta-barrel domain-containing protein [unclassified Chelatococcus]MBS7738572.1 autotransporter outer membrane beta-barrel domain-containing protein [Chelatococcus sp. HY11]MBX3542976.1 autotransporter outer membrane beta-barrel domain-containing protein [Chelatococcus sp.]MCO5076898.1 autotransporter outer membrane beta-barrel domain-containing protein [Chelatococcus sp.]
MVEANAGAGEESKSTEPQQPEGGNNAEHQGDGKHKGDGEHKGEVPKPQGETQKRENSAEKPSASASDTTKGDAGYNRISPSRSDVARMALAAQRFSRGLIAQHQLNADGGTVADDKASAGGPDGTLWMSPVVGLGRITATRGGRLRYDSRGVFVGVDRTYGNLLVGGMVGHLSTSGRSANGRIDHDGFQAALYGRVDLGSFVLRGDIGGSFNSYALSERSLAAMSRRDMQRFSAAGYGFSGGAFAGYVTQMAGIRVIPEIGLEFDRTTLSGMRGAAASARPDLAGAVTVNNLRGLVGGRMEMPLPFKKADGVNVKLKAYWARDLVADSPASAIVFPAVFNQMAADQKATGARRRSPDAAILGAEIEGRIGKNTTLSASYVTERRGAETSHAVLAGLRVNW